MAAGDTGDVDHATIGKEGLPVLVLEQLVAEHLSAARLWASFSPVYGRSTFGTASIMRRVEEHLAKGGSVLMQSYDWPWRPMSTIPGFGPWGRCSKKAKMRMVQRRGWNRTRRLGR